MDATEICMCGLIQHGEMAQGLAKSGLNSVDKEMRDTGVALPAQAIRDSGSLSSKLTGPS